MLPIYVCKQRMVNRRQDIYTLVYREIAIRLDEQSLQSVIIRILQ